jgi:hypothetical protein
MLNYETPGSERANISDIKSSLPVIVNEDYCMLVRITSPDDGSGGVYSVNAYQDGYPCIVKGQKVWDMGAEKKDFYFMLLYAGKSEYPGPKTVTYNQVIPIHRVGEYEGTGTYGFELHEENSTKISWVAFVNVPQMILVQVTGSQATPVVYENGAWVEKGTAKTATPLGINFYGSPLVSGSKYLAYETANAYMIEVRGYGEKAKTITGSVNQLRISVDVDPTGKVLAITASELT